MIDWNKFDFSPIGLRAEVSPDTIGISVLLKKVLEAGEGCVSRFFREGYSDTAFDTIVSNIKKLNGNKIHESINSIQEEYLYKFDNAFLELSITRTKLISLNCISTDPAIIDMCKEVSSLFQERVKKGYVFAITRGMQGSLQLTRIGYAGCKLEKDNYDSEVQKDYDYIIDDLKSKDPTGRIVILDGPAGCGKTFVTRGILMDVPNAMFVIVPPNMVASIGGPELMPLLLRTKEEYGKKGPTVLVLEDADQCLAPRAADNMSSISSILNLGDGIFGAIFDVRIIATTNAKAKDIDPAIVRDMRLSKRISINPFQYNDANKIYKRLLKNDDAILPRPTVETKDMRFRVTSAEKKEIYTLAEIYKLARIAGWKSDKASSYDDTNNKYEEPSIIYDEDFDV